MVEEQEKTKDEWLMTRALERLLRLRDSCQDPMERRANGLTYIIEDLEARLALYRPRTEGAEQ